MRCAYYHVGGESDFSSVTAEAFSQVCLICWISDTLSQGYTDLQSLLKCLDHRGIVLVLDTRCSQARAVLGCAIFRKFDVTAVIEQAKQSHVDHFCIVSELISLVLYIQRLAA